jgi:hypothetical protein
MSGWEPGHELLGDINQVSFKLSRAEKMVSGQWSDDLFIFEILVETGPPFLTTDN